MGLSASLNTAISGLRTTQVGIGIVSENVSNAGTAGYVRRQVGTTDTLSANSIGTQNTNVQRMLDAIVQRQLWQESSGAAYTSTRANSLSTLDKLYGAPGSTTALDTVYNNFTSALQGLQNDPSSYSLRTSVLDAASQLASRLNGLSSGVQALRTQAEAGIANGVTKVNQLLDSLTTVNARIVGSPNDTGAADLKDQRDRIVSELSQYVDIKTSEDARGSLSIITSSGTQIFDGRPAVTFSFAANSSLDADAQWNSDPALRGVGTITMTNVSGNSTDAIANKTFRSGEIAANIELRDKTLVQAQAQLDEIAAQLSSALSDREVKGTTTTAGTSSQADLDFDLSTLSRGNSLTFDYKATPGGPTQRLTFVNASGATLPASATGDANNRVVPIDFSGGTAAAIAAIQSAINANAGAGFTVSNPAGNALRITDDGAGNTRDVVGLTARPTTTSLSTSVAPPGTAPVELPFFVDGGRGNIAYTGSFENGSQLTGFASRIVINADLVANRAALVVSNTAPGNTTAQGDTTRPLQLLQRLTQSQRAFTNSGTLDGSTATSSGTVSNLVQRVVSSQGQAVEAAKSLNEGQQVALASIQSRFQDTAKVNVDQEMATLIELQSAYAANARIISTVKEMMDVLLRI